MTLPLQGLRVLAVEQYGAAPYGTLQLASLGAEVIKVETPGQGDVSRGVGPFFLPGDDGGSLFFQGLNHSKRSIALDLRTEQGRDILLKLVAGSDGVVHNLRGDVPQRLRLDYASLRQANERVVCVHLTAYGRDGPRADWPGYDYVMQAQAGYFSLTGEPDGPPARFGLSVVDLQAGVTMAMALLAGVLQARSSGRGRDLDVSLYDVALHNLNYIAMWSLNAGHHQGRVPRSAHFSMNPCQLYKTADGWIYLMCNKEKFWRALCRAIGRPHLQDDPRFATFADRLQHRDELTEALDDALSAHATATWLERFGKELPAAPVLNVEQALAEDFPRTTGRILEYETRNGNRVRTLKPPVHTAAEPRVGAAPEMGEHTDELLAQLGYSESAIRRLREANIVQ